MTRRRLWITLLVTLGIAWGTLGASLGVGWEPRLGLDLQGGFSVRLVAPDGTDGEVLDQAVEIMRQRIENLGQVQEPEISVQGDRAIVVQLPGVTDRERALAAVGTTGELTFRPVLTFNLLSSPAFLDGTLPPPEGAFPDSTTVTTQPPEISGDTTTTTESPSDTSTTTQAPSDSSTTVAPTTTAPPTTTTTTTAPPPPPENIDPETGLTIEDDPTQETYLLGEDGVTYYHLAPAFLYGSDIEDADAALTGGGGTLGEWVVDPSFTSDGGELFRAATGLLARQPVGSPTRSLAIVVDGVVFSAPAVAPDVGPEGLDPNNVIITVGGENQEEEARDLATILRYGALPTVFEREREESVSASLGSDSLQAGLIAGLGGLTLVAIALLLYYRALGLVAVVGLSVFGSLLLTAIILLGEFQGTTLTLAGVTGIIVSIGITADSYIVFFERIKEEHRRGRPLRPSVDSGFQRAFRTIVTADVVTFSASVLLWALAIGPVKGFAITLGIATVVDVFVAYYYTRPAVMLLVRSRLGEGGYFSIRGAMGRGIDEVPEGGAA
ncbi:MAG: protein translocase subunit SecD [Acidimicrobiia bacterium]|nr:protein translocase subunit SecD [Acidimicrobiia bacterium]